MQINRLFEIVYLLMHKKTVTARELAERFEVSTRTIYRDIETLSGTGIPVYMSKGKGGGIFLLPEFVLNKAVLTDEEQENILSSLKAVNAVDLSDKNTALNKLSSLFGESNTDWIEVDFSSWTNNENESEIFNRIKASILEKKVVRFSYANTQGQTSTREVEPLKLCFKGIAWYLYGYCRSKTDYRFFKLRRLKKLEVLEEEFSRKSPVQLFTKQMNQEEKIVTIKLKLSSNVAFRVYDEFEHYEQLQDGNFIVEFDYPAGEWIYYYINSFGEHGEVLEPLELRNEIKTRLEKTLKKYI